ncbi:hypothetical protein ACFL4L_06290, partial [bacterium]
MFLGILHFFSSKLSPIIWNISIKSVFKQDQIFRTIRKCSYTKEITEPLSGVESHSAGVENGLSPVENHSGGVENDISPVENDIPLGDMIFYP